MQEKEIKTLSPKLDVIFQALFGTAGNEKITKGFLESVLKERIDEIDLDKNPILRREFKDDKLGVLDIIAEINGQENCNIEMQIVNKDNIIERILFYWSRLFSKTIKIGEDYEKLKKTIVILIADFEIEELKELGYHSIWKIIETEKRKKVLTNKMELHIIELPKVKGEEKVEDKLLDWLYFLENPKGRRVKEKMEENEELKEAGEKLDGLSADERMQKIAELRQKAIMDEKATYRKGLKDGIKDGMKQGIEKGREDGIRQGQEQKNREIAKKMLDENADIDFISRVTGLSKEEIEAMK